MNPNDYDKLYEVYTTLQTTAANGGIAGLDKFYEVYTMLQMIAANGGIASLDKDEADALVQGIEELHRHAERLIEVYDHYVDIQEVGGEPLQEVVENLAHIVDRTGGESR